ncbi:hypothetical protein GCM10007862_34520 [Dyella lipolytica]|uniref:Uncharacterized protein n=1 Tax=Dyella lipolytica TaxID=1867835 RepID=A0ABW8IYR1_9GAMM|nr:hypothetical protein [Dyella lipolytica]GLQ48401.1 hypothetical protein GCM10007862_34520 [Dyella lipolytica]
MTNASRMAGTALAVAVIEGILEKHSAFKREQKSGESGGFLPLNPVQLNGLNAAIYFLHHYVDTLTPELGG